jgi:hypothetical protein
MISIRAPLATLVDPIGKIPVYLTATVANPSNSR